MNRFRELRLATGYRSQQELADVLYVNQTAVSQWERGSTLPNMQMLLKLSELYGVTTDYLLGQDKQTSSGVQIPVLGSIPAGIPLEAVEDIVDWEDIPDKMTRGGKQYFALRVTGDSMYPKYLSGDTVIVQKQPVCESGDDCVVYVNGFDATLKTVRLHSDGSLTTEPINPTYAPRTYTPEEIKTLPVSIAGVVVELRRKVKK